MFFKSTKFSKFLVLILFLSSSLTLFSQNNTVSASGNQSGSSGSFSYSLGQVFSASNTSSSGTVSEGLQQALEIYLLDFAPSQHALNFHVNIFPNPSSEWINVEIQSEQDENLKSVIYDLNGRQIQSSALSKNNNRISIAEFKSGIYYLEISQKNKTLKTYKIIKH